MRPAERLLVGASGLLLRGLSALVPKDPGLWLFGSLDGQRFADNPKQLFLHLLRREPAGVRIVWIARSAQALAAARAHGGEARHNYSPAGIWAVLRARQLVVSTKRSDVLFFFLTRGRRVFTLHHGMPIKKILHDYDGPLRREADAPLKDALWTRFVVGFRWSEVAAVVCTSPFYKRILASAFRTERVHVTGQPRTDAFFGADVPAIRRRLGLGEGFVAAYMPTHRGFGSGPQGPLPFAADPAAVQRLRQRGIRLAYKLHPSMLARGTALLPAGVEDVLVDLSLRCEDPQELLLAADCLITDYSSAFIDYLLLDRPVLLYVPDEEEYVRGDNPVYFRLAEHPVGPILGDESALLEALLAARAGADDWRAERARARELFHTYTDGLSSERVWRLLEGLAGDGAAYH